MAAKKIAAFYLDSEIEIRPWQMERYGFKRGQYFKRPFQIGVFLPVIVSLISIGNLFWMASMVFDVKPKTAKILKGKFPSLRLAPSVAHPHDIARYNNSVGNTLITIEEALALADEGIINGVWGDEWDLQGENGGTKQLYTPEFFKQLHKAGLFVALVTPELHGTSPGLYGGESHPDAKDLKTLFERIKQIKEAGADYLCTDYPEEVSHI